MLQSSLRAEAISAEPATPSRQHATFGHDERICSMTTNALAVIPPDRADDLQKQHMRWIRRKISTAAFLHGCTLKAR